MLTPTKYKYIFANKTSVKIPKGNQNPHIKEEQTTQWSKEKVQKNNDLQSKHIKLKVE